MKKLLAFLERWFILLFGGGGMVFLFRRKTPGRYDYLVFIALGLMHVAFSYVNARFFLPVTTTPLVPAAVSVHQAAFRVLGPRRFARWRG